jgi:DNA-binding MarR family transcriptional regulator
VDTPDRQRALAAVEEAFAAFAAGASPSRLGARLGSSVDIGHAGFPILRHIEAAAPVRVTDLAEHAGLDVSTVSRRVSDLQEKGLVTRETDREDQRASLLELTPLGREVLASRREGWRRLLEEALASWETPDIQSLADSLSRFAAALAEVL